MSRFTSSCSSFLPVLTSLDEPEMGERSSETKKRKKRERTKREKESFVDSKQQRKKMKKEKKKIGSELFLLRLSDCKKTARIFKRANKLCGIPWKSTLDQRGKRQGIHTGLGRWQKIWSPRYCDASKLDLLEGIQKWSWTLSA